MPMQNESNEDKQQWRNILGKVKMDTFLTELGML